MTINAWLKPIMKVVTCLGRITCTPPLSEAYNEKLSKGSKRNGNINGQ